MEKTNFQYLKTYSRLTTKEINIGVVAMGGMQPIRIQSMTNTPTENIDATVKQSIELIENGCELVRITVPYMEDVEKLKQIKNLIRAKGYQTPLIADVHLNYKVAEEVARVVEKVRINPGNYADKKAFKYIDYSDEAYNSELERIAERIYPLLKICQEYGTVIRIGTNHGSLSDRIVSRFGNTPEGMVASALEFVSICESFGFHNLVLSMKSSNVKVMVQSYRLLVSKLLEKGTVYPLHLGVTEAGYGLDGIIKSYCGIGALLEDGIGDTIRVSLTGDPVQEIKPALALASRFNQKKKEKQQFCLDSPINPFHYSRKKSIEVFHTGASQPIAVAITNHAVAFEESSTVFKIQWGQSIPDFSFFIGKNNSYQKIQFFHSKQQAWENYTFNKLSFNFIESSSFQQQQTSFQSNEIIVLCCKPNEILTIRSAIFHLIQSQTSNPIWIKYHFKGNSFDEFVLQFSTEIGLLLVDGLIDAIWVDCPNLSNNQLVDVVFQLLQASRERITGAEFISCPTCGRTQYDLSLVLKELEQFKPNLKGLKIAVMGCVVNGPGEMADADYGYVGAGNSKVNLYKGQTVVKKLVDSNDAVPVLIQLIKDNGDWKEKV